MSFTSGKISHDPMPWRSRGGIRSTERVPLAGSGVAFFFSPRPEFDNHNPILVQFREFVGLPNEWLDYLNGPGVERAKNGDLWTPEHIDHARRVLLKLAAIA